MIRSTLSTVSSIALITLAATSRPEASEGVVFVIPSTITASCNGCIGSLKSEITDQPASSRGCAAPSFVGSGVQGPTNGTCESYWIGGCDAEGECSYSINVELQFPSGSSTNCFPQLWVDGGGIDPSANRLVNSFDFGTQTSKAKCKTGDSKEDGDIISIALFSDGRMSTEVGYFERQVQCTHCNRKKNATSSPLN